MVTYLLRHLVIIFPVTSLVAIPRFRIFPPRMVPAFPSSDSSFPLALPTAERAFCTVGTILPTTAPPVDIKASVFLLITSEMSTVTVGICCIKLFCAVIMSTDTSVDDWMADPKPEMQ